jgi:hypothetical protein
MKELLEIDLPFDIRFNCGVTIDNHFISDTNNSSNWKTIKFKLPIGKWTIRNQIGNKIMLQNNE